MLLCVSFDLTNQVWNYFEFFFFVQNILCVWDFKGRMFENLNFGKTGFNTCVLEKRSISYSWILFIIFNALRSFLKKPSYLFQFSVFPEFWLIQSVFRSIEITFKIFCEPLSVSINRNSWIRFLKNHIWLVQNTFSNTFQISFSLPDSARLHKEFFVVFLQISCKVSLSLSQYVYITLPFALFFSFSCIISWFLGNFQTMLYLGFFINQALFYEFDQWVLLLQWYIHDICWLI